MPRAIWSGAISFGLVNIPIKLYAAVSRKSVHFNQLDSRTGSRIKYKKVSAADGEEVPSEAIVKGYELSSGEYVTVGDDELSSLDPTASRTIDIEEFVDLARSEEHTSELQSLMRISYAVFCLKKKKHKH